MKLKFNVETYAITLSCVYCDHEWTTTRHLQGLNIKCPECGKVNEVNDSEWLPELKGDK